MAGVALLEIGDVVPVVLQLPDGATDVFPQAEVYDDNDISLITIDLVHKNNGLYAPASQYSMPDEDYITITYIVYTVDYGDTESDIYLRDVDVYEKIKPANYKADVTNLDIAVSTRSSHTAADVWNVATRTLTSFGTLVADIWGYVTRILTAGTKDAEIDAIKNVTDTIDGMIEDVGGDRYTQKALEQAPTAEMDETELHTALDSYSNKDDWKLTALNIADAVWDSLWSDHVDVNSFGELMRSILRLTGNDVTRSGDVITIYDEVDAPWRSYNLGNGGRIKL